MLPWRDARAQILAATKPGPIERTGVEHAYGRVLAEALHARWDLPGHNVSMMDGYALRSWDLAAGRTSLVVVAESAAGHPSGEALGQGQAMRISTGAVLPSGADIVVPQEDTQRLGSALEVDLDRFGSIAALRFVRTQGSDFKLGEHL